MFLREGSQQRAGWMVLCCATLSGVALSGSAVAENVFHVGQRQIIAGQSTAAQGIELPREILPWRRSLEDDAANALQNARRAIEAGDRMEGRRRLQALIEKFPQTHAFRDARQELAALDTLRLLEFDRRGLGVPARVTETGVSAMPPVAGWQTTISPNPESLHESLIEAAGDRVFFEENSTRLDERAEAVIKKQALWLKSNEDVEIRIAGHADDRGSPEVNMRLAHDRAVNVRRRLILHGVPASRLHVFSHGDAKPIAICEVSSCAIQNRRVVTEITAPKRAAVLD